MKLEAHWKFAAASMWGAAFLAGCAWFFAAKPAASQDTSAGKKFCVGCSVDGKTPRTADGHPDLSGYWGGGNAPPPGAQGQGGRGGAAGAAGAAGGAQGRGGIGGNIVQKSSDGSILFDFSTQYNADEGLGRICLPLDESCQQPNQPPYNAEYMMKVRAIAKTEFGGTTDLDPLQHCRALGVPRAGFPQQIVQTPDVILFLYSAAPYTTFREIYMNGRPHPDPKDYETSYFGDSIGHWEGDTLVVDTTGFNDDTWLGGGGATGTAQFTSVHSNKEHVTERLGREGDVMTYDVTVDDPEALTKPWVLPTRRIRHSGPGMEVPGDDAIYEEICEPTTDIVQPSPEDTDIKNKCGYRCDTNKGKGDATGLSK